MKLMLMSFNRKKKMLRLWRLGHNQQSVTIWFIQRVCPECCLSLWQRGSPAPVNSVSQQTLENAKCSQKTVTDFQQHLKGTCVPNSRQREENALFSQKRSEYNYNKAVKIFKPEVVRAYVISLLIYNLVTLLSRFIKSFP